MVLTNLTEIQIERLEVVERKLRDYEELFRVKIRRAENTIDRYEEAVKQIKELLKNKSEFSEMERILFNLNLKK